MTYHEKLFKCNIFFRVVYQHKTLQPLQRSYLKSATEYVKHFQTEENFPGMKNVIINYAPVIILCQLSSYDNTVLQLLAQENRLFLFVLYCLIDQNKLKLNYNTIQELHFLKQKKKKY